MVWLRIAKRVTFKGWCAYTFGRIHPTESLAHLPEVSSFRDTVADEAWKGRYKNTSATLHVAFEYLQ